MIDDSAADGVAFRRIAATKGMDLDACADWPRAQRLLAREPYDCVLVDYRLGPHDGLKLIRTLISQRPERAVIVATGQGNERIAVEALHAGAKDYLVKANVTAESLARCVSNAVHKTRLEQELKSQRRDLESFASVVAHDLQQPLCSIKGNVEVLAEFFIDKSSEQGQEFAAAAIRTVARMDELLVKLLHYCRADTAETLGPVDLNSVLQLTLENLEAGVRDSGAIVQVDQLPLVCGSRPLLIQLFQNLIWNAIQYNDAKRPEIEVRAQRHKGVWQIRVADNGPGVPPDKLESIFQPFIRAVHGGRLGFGLGLATSRRIAERIGGAIYARNRPQGGTEFVVEAPAAAPPHDTRATQPRAADSLP